MANWRDDMQHSGLDLCGGGRSLLVLTFAHNIFIFGIEYHVTRALLENLLKILQQWDYTSMHGQKGPHNTGPTTVTIADAEWIAHISS